MRGCVANGNIKAQPVAGVTSIRTLHVLTAIVLLLGGCATSIPFDRAAAAEKISQDLDIPLEAIEVVSRCSVLVAQSLNEKPPIRFCLYVATPRRMVLIDHDEVTQRYREFARIDASIAKQIGFTTFGRARQVQVHTAAGIYGIEIGKPDTGMVDQAGSRAAYERLKAMGIPEIENVKFIHATVPVQQGPIYVPIYLPSR
jgi:hypothetical protein